jgi:hypothetical protein
MKNKAKMYVEPFGENKLPLHKIANIDECMKSYNKVYGILLSEQDLKTLFIAGFMLGNGSYQLKKEVDIDLEFEKQIQKL